MGTEDNSDIFFHEVQQFKKIWFWVALVPFSLFLVLFFVFGMYRQLALGKPIGSRPMPDAAMMIGSQRADKLASTLIPIFLPFRHKL